MNIAVVGGGLAGLFSSIWLNRQGHKVTLIEKKIYPFHRVCGEYLSLELIPLLKSEGLYPADAKPSLITQFILSSPSGRVFKLPLDMGGFGISRFYYDHWLACLAKSEGVHVLENTSVEGIKKEGNSFNILLKNRSEFMEADLVVGAFGKRSSLDYSLARPWKNTRSPYVGVKYHMQIDYPSDTVALHNFPGGYCGISAIEDGKFNVCYLVHRSKLKKTGTIQRLEEEIICQNPHLHHIFTTAKVLFDKPEVINEISFTRKGASFDGIPMLGDAAGMIVPLTGHGMTIAIRSARLLCEVIGPSLLTHKKHTSDTIVSQYERKWKKEFGSRISVSLLMQSLFGHNSISELAVWSVQKFPSIGRWLMKQTHGDYIMVK